MTSGRPRDGAARPAPGRTSTARSRSEFTTTLTDDSAIAPAASAGLSVIPNAGYSTPIATGMSTTL